MYTLREESSETNVILQYKLLAAILSVVCSVIQQSQYVLHFYYTLYDVKYDCKITAHQTIFQLQCFVLLNNHQYNYNITKSFLGVPHIKHHTCITGVVKLALYVCVIEPMHDYVTSNKDDLHHRIHGSQNLRHPPKRYVISGTENYKCL